jgi:hypothetical protein
VRARIGIIALAAASACAQSAEPIQPTTTSDATSDATPVAADTRVTADTGAASSVSAAASSAPTKTSTATTDPASSASTVSSAPTPAATAPVSTSASARVEARSAQLVAVGTVHGERMTIHLSHLEDNAPLRDAEVALVLRGVTHAATALADGGYAVATPDLALPGPAAVRVEVTSSGTRQDLEGTLQPTAAPVTTEDKSSSRQLGWWVLNFAVCIGFLWLWQRRKRHDPDEEAPG